MANELKELHRQMRKQGYNLLTAFNNTYKPGMMVKEASWRELPPVGEIADAMEDGSFPALSKSESASLLNFARDSQLSAKAAADWLMDAASANGNFTNDVVVVCDFEEATVQSVSLVKLSTVVSSQLSKDSKGTLARFLRAPGIRLVSEVVKAKLSFRYTADGGVDLAVDGSVSAAGPKLDLKAGFTWKNKSTIVSAEPIVVAVRLADWSKTRRVFEHEKV